MPPVSPDCVSLASKNQQRCLSSLQKHDVTMLITAFLQVDHLKSEMARLIALVPGGQANGKDSNGLVPTGGKDTVV